MRIGSGGYNPWAAKMQAEQKRIAEEQKAQQEGQPPAAGHGGGGYGVFEELKNVPNQQQENVPVGSESGLSVESGGVNMENQGEQGDGTPEMFDENGEPITTVEQINSALAQHREDGLDRMTSEEQEREKEIERLLGKKQEAVPQGMGIQSRSSQVNVNTPPKPRSSYWDKKPAQEEKQFDKKSFWDNISKKTGS